MDLFASIGCYVQYVCRIFSICGRLAKRILIAPLDWGLGHATRCIPIIGYLLELGHQPVIAASGRPLQLLQAEFPKAEFVDFQGYDITYPEGSGMAWKMFRSTPHILKRISDEHRELQSLIKKLKLDAVISDNRFGLHTKLVPCVYMTHQVMIKAPLFEDVLYRFHADFMRKFTYTWVPDFAENGLSGDLAHRYPLPRNGRFIGSLSRFSALAPTETLDVLILISGPEPQRTRFERMVLSQLEQFDGAAMAVLGTPEKVTERLDAKSHRIVSHLSAKQLQQAVANAHVIVSRSGYSTVMDLSVMGKKAVFVPTPGQTEQEYLARMFHANRTHYRMLQGNFNLQKALKEVETFSGFEARPSDGYRSAVDALLTSLS